MSNVLELLNPMRNSSIKRSPKNIKLEIDNNIKNIQNTIYSASNADREEVLDIIANALIDLHKFYQKIEKGN